jgi:hypothetical protein
MGILGAGKTTVTQARPEATVHSYALVIVLCAYITAAMWFRCLVKATSGFPPTYTWYEMTFLSIWEPGRYMTLCIDTPNGFREELQHSLEREQKLDLQDPFAFLLPLMDQIILLYDHSVWGIRDLIRQVEKVTIITRLRFRQVADNLAEKRRPPSHRHRLLTIARDLSTCNPF